MAPLNPLFEFRVHPTIASLEAPLGKGSDALDRLAAGCDDGSEYRFGVMSIRGKSREVAIPKPGLDAVQRRISQILYPVDLSFGASPHGYVTRKSTLTNARPHTGARFLQKFDIKNFFSNISANRIESTLQGLGFGSEAATLLSRLTSFRGTLPLGARTSPRISNMVLMGLDKEVEELAQQHGLIYTRYADDLTFSARQSFDVGREVQEAVEAVGFELNSSKTKRFKHGQPMFVTGLSVEDEKFPRVRKRLKAKLRQEFYYIEKFGLDGHATAIGENPIWTASRLSGQFHYSRTVEPDFSDALARDYPVARAKIAPEHVDSRPDRARRHRQEFLSDVSRASSKSLPIYVPSVAFLDE